MDTELIKALGASVAEVMRDERREIERRAATREARLEAQIAGLRREIEELRAVANAILGEPA